MPLSNALSQDSTYKQMARQYLDLRRSLQEHRLDLPVDPTNGLQTDAYVEQQMPLLQSIQRDAIADIGPQKWQQLLMEVMHER